MMKGFRKLTVRFWPIRKGLEGQCIIISVHCSLFKFDDKLIDYMKLKFKNKFFQVFNKVSNMVRFSKDDVHLLHDLLRVPEFYWCPNETVVGGLESFLLLLRRLTYPNRLSDLCSLFGRFEPDLSMIVHKVH